jgi:DNA-binding PadR family transcriptional regulator
MNMISKNAERRVLASQRQVMQYLRSGDWNIVTKMPVAATAGALNRLVDYGWIERRGGGPRSEIKLTPAGVAALQAPI